MPCIPSSRLHVPSRLQLQLGERTHTEKNGKYYMLWWRYLTSIRMMLFHLPWHSVISLEVTPDYLTYCHLLSLIGRVIIETPLGLLVGHANKSFRTFLGIRYALPPTGELRFKAPHPAPSWVSRTTQFFF